MMEVWEGDDPSPSFEDELISKNRLLNHVNFLRNKSDVNNMLAKYMIYNSNKNITFCKAKLKNWDYLESLYGQDMFGNIACNFDNKLVVTKHMYDIMKDKVFDITRYSSDGRVYIYSKYVGNNSQGLYHERNLDSYYMLSSIMIDLIKK